MKIMTAMVLSLVSVGAVASAQNRLQASGVRGGLIVHVGCGRGVQTGALNAGKSFIVQGLDTDPANVRWSRELFRKLRAARETNPQAGAYGQITAAQFDGKTLPYIDNMVNLIIADADTTAPMAEILRAQGEPVFLLDGPPTAERLAADLLVRVVCA